MNAVTPITRALTAYNQTARNDEIDSFARRMTECEQVRMLVAIIQGGARIEQSDDLVDALAPLSDVLSANYKAISFAAAFGDSAKRREGV